jgi:hypothetical protein
MFIIEDEWHAEPLDGQFETREQAIDELRRVAAIPWNEAPNRAPCTSWMTCGRRYELIEYDDTASSWTQISRAFAMEISGDGVRCAEASNPEA